MQIKAFLIIILLGFSVSCYSASPGLDITYSGNEGFLISSKNRKVLIDALFRSNYPNF